MQKRSQSNSHGGVQRSLPDIGRSGPLARYVLLWTAAAAVVVLVVLGVIRALDDAGRPREMEHPASAGVLATRMPPVARTRASRGPRSVRPAARPWWATYGLVPPWTARMFRRLRSAHWSQRLNAAA
jgi:hypothetical protein